MHIDEQRLDTIAEAFAQVVDAKSHHTYGHSARVATYSEQILARLNIFSELAVVAAAHHERLDGKGYPRGITAEHISLKTRIITVADFFDAITADRPYRGPIPVVETIAMMEKKRDSAILTGRAWMP